MFLEANGQLEILGNLRYNVGARYIKTDQFVSGCITVPNADNAPPPACSTRIVSSSTDDTDYDKVLPSFNVASDLGQGLRVACRGVEDHDSSAAGRHRAEPVAEHQRRRLHHRQPGAGALLLRQLRPGSRVVLR